MARYRVKSVGVRSGSVWFYEEPRALDNNTYSSWSQDTINTAPGALPNDLLGTSVTLNQNLYVVGLPGRDMALVYYWLNSKWNLVKTLTGPAGSQFGFAVAASGNNIAVGAPNYNNGLGRVYIFENSGGAWRDARRGPLDPANEDGAKFGYSLELDGSMLVVGAPDAHGGGGADRYGAVYTYKYDWITRAWTDMAVIISDYPEHGSGFGSSVSIDKELTIAIGAPRQNVNAGETIIGAGRVFMHQRDNNGWRYQSQVNAPSPETSMGFGSSVSIRADRLVVGAPNASGGGCAYVYDGHFGQWVFGADLSVRTSGSIIVDSNAGATDQQGACVHQLATKNLVLVGAPGYTGGGCVFAYEFTAAGNWKGLVTPKLTGTDTMSGDAFGSSMAADQNNLLVGAPHAAVSQGKYYHFKDSRNK